ncbi:3-keto-disaccharide hydrolase [Leeuwenhoekiella parthenopeia]|uniref:DUF1080 domain-containing protein n=1 Tax=Leeuwenhoekiella parthenopeia TaxID=2890320 RepID=A0ABS8GMR0_9FLAO|nr:DUF1080 domain-containing protein [Leeuwenhoekiella parthenopeia]MCC4211266.1 DUF1080 domain-containing protein [Leeuwenhoekiella parthenopeia]
MITLKSLLISLTVFSTVFACSERFFRGDAIIEKSPETVINSEEGFLSLYNGIDMSNWNLLCRDNEEGLAERVFTAGENGELHVFKDFPDEYGYKENRSGTHCMFFTPKKYSRYIFRFEYKWGEKRFNNFDQFQYDAGLYFHVYDVKIWPKGIEYQVRYDHTQKLNHTGDIWNSGAGFDWVASDENTYLPLAEGGRVQKRRGGEHRARSGIDFNALNGKWNQCELIVMADEYAIFKLNGQVVNVLTNMDLSEGEIGLQAETAEIYYRNIKIKEFKKFIPIEDFLKEGQH